MRRMKKNNEKVANMEKINADSKCKEDKEMSETSMEKELEGTHNLIALIHSYRRIIDFEKKSMKKLKKYASPDKTEQIKKHLKDAEKVLNELMDDVLDDVFKNMKCFKHTGTGRRMKMFADLLGVNDVGDLSLDVKEEPSPVSSTCILKIRIGDNVVYGFPRKLTKYLSKDDWHPFYDHINKAALQVVKNQIKGHEKNGDKKYLPFEIMITAQYQISGNLDQIECPLVKIPFSKDDRDVQKKTI